MKKILCFIFAIAATASILLSLASCTEECKHVDADDDYECDKCGADYDDGDEYEAPVVVDVNFTVKIVDGDTVNGAKFVLVTKNAEKSLTSGSDGKVSASLEVGKYEVVFDTESLPENCLSATYEITIDKNTDNITLDIIDNTPDGTKEKPYFLAEKKNSITIPAGIEYYYSFHGTSDSHLEVAGENIIVTFEGQSYTPVNGIVTVLFEDSMGAAVKFSVKNNNTEAVDLQVDLVSPLGSRENPIELAESSKIISIENGESVYYKWVSAKSGILVLKSENKNNNIGMTNITTNAASAQTFGERGSYLTVSEGDEVLIAVSSVSNEASEIDINLDVYEGTEADPLPIIKDKIDISLAPGASFTFTAEEGLEITISDADVTLSIGGTVHTPDSLDMIIVTLEGTNIFTVSNTSAEQNGIVVDFE